MDVREVIVNETLPQIPAGMVAFDLEMANSFANAPPVICMIGMGRYDSEAGHCVSTIASITSRREERELIEWFVRELSGLADRHSHPRLLSFSGLENDVPWLEQRLQRFDLPPEQSGTLERFEHVDLKAEFYRRTHSDHMSLKNLERIFGIGRESSIQSRKVSFILTDVMSSRRRGSSIPEKIFRYLHEDVHHLLLIYNRWEQVSLDEFRLTDEEYLNFLNSLKNALHKLVQSPLARRSDTQRAVKNLGGYLKALSGALDKALVDQTFAEFELPPLPEFDGRHRDLGRIKKKHARLSGISLRDAETGAYQLRSRLRKPKGALAVVRHRGRLLMIRRADGLKRAAGYWGLPGGSLEEGESPSIGAVRELWEELNLYGTAGRILGTSTSVGGEYTLYWVEVEVDDLSTLNAEQSEVAEVRWMAQGEIASLDPLIPGALEGFHRFLGPEWQ